MLKPFRKYLAGQVVATFFIFFFAATRYRHARDVPAFLWVAAGLWVLTPFILLVVLAVRQARRQTR